jgi:uridine kinase
VRTADGPRGATTPPPGPGPAASRPGSPFLVGIAGGSGAGKTALARALAAGLGPERAGLLGQDAYYRDRWKVPPEARAALDFDAPDAFDHGLFFRHVQSLRQGLAVRPPNYCFVTHCRLGPGAPVEPREVLIVEGIMLYHEPRIADLIDLRLFVDAPGDLRLHRRLRRDTLERGRSARAVVEQFRTTVEPAHTRWVAPTRARADLILVNVGRLEHLAEIALTVVRARLATRRAGAA